MSVTSKNDRRRNYDYGGSDDGINDKLVSTIKGHHRFVKVVDGERKYIDIYTTRYTPGSKIRCATSGHIFNSIVCYEEGLNNVGFNLRDKSHTSENHYISCLMKNYSHDIRLASIVVKQSRKMNKLFGRDRIIYTGN